MRRDVLLVLMVGVVLGGACRRGSDVDDTRPGPKPVDGAAEPVEIDYGVSSPVVFPVASPAKTHKSGPRLLPDAEIPFAVCAVTATKEGVVRVGLLDKDSGSFLFLEPGQVCGGYELVAYDEEQDGALFLHVGEEVMVHLSSGLRRDEPGAVGAPEPLQAVSPDQIDLSKVVLPHFEPTASEKERGIDPQNVSTWPEGYKGPAIERMIQKQRDAGISPDVHLVPLTAP